ncbi:MAG: hypothetical protein J0I29_16330 [Rhizobiales bacterium]|nr:hypothetical protein [Hyphomicrobiales bacterium]
MFLGTRPAKNPDALPKEQRRQDCARRQLRALIGSQVWTVNDFPAILASVLASIGPFRVESGAFVEHRHPGMRTSLYMRDAEEKEGER